jgi:hypothetical protein
MMNLNNIPNGLHHLVKLVEEWGVNDDGYRDEYIEKSQSNELISFINSITEQDLELMNEWLSDEKEIAKSSDEYINYTCFQMAYDYSKSVLKSRNYQSPLCEVFLTS